MAWAPDYISVAELKSFVRVDDTLDDAEIAFAIAGASRAIDRSANRQFGVVDALESRSYTPYWDRRQGLYVIQIDDLMTATGLTVTTVKGVTVAAQVSIGDGGYVLREYNAPQVGRPWTHLNVPNVSSRVIIEALWGWTEVPQVVKEAALIQSSRLLKRRESPFGVAGSPDLGNELRLLSKLDPDVSVMVGTVQRWWAAA